MKAFVTDGDQRPALAITRSLGRRGIAVVVGEERPVSLASSSRYCVGSVTYPSPYQHPEAFDRFLRDFVEREQVDVVIPVTDVTTYATARSRNALEHHSAIAGPSFDTFDLVADKWNLLQRASACGIQIPRTHFVDGIAALKAILPQVAYPAVVKPVRSRTLTSRGWLGAGVQYAHSESDLLRLYRTTDHLACYPSLVQERIVGPGTGVFVLCDRGEVRVAFAHRRLREKPPSGGVSVLCESIAPAPRLLDQAARLLGPLGWHGVAMLEYKEDRRTGQPFLMEVNGRFWGSLQLAVDAGVDFPYLNWQLALGQGLDICPDYRIGVRSRWLLGDVDHLLLRLFHSNRDLPDSVPSKLQTLMQFLQFAAPGLRYEVFSREDPRPMIHEMRQYARQLAVSAIDRVRRYSGRPNPSPALYQAPVATTFDRGKHARALK
jgi:predicted ATP-grasp superfamily ATP-dependent carboligase